MKKITYLLMFFVALLLPGCRVNEDENIDPLLTLAKEAPVTFSEPAKLIAFVDDKQNGFVKTKSIGNITYSAILKPIDYMLSQKQLQENNMTLSKDDFEDLQYFDLCIKVEDFHQEFIKYNLQSAGQYQQRVSYCAFDMQKDIKLVDGKDTLACMLYHYERAFDVAPYGHFILAFEPDKNKTVTVKTLVFYDRLFNNGTIKFTFPPKIMVKEPTLL
jgi:hypothetical protein